MVVCKCRKATKLYCFVHKSPLCLDCICSPDHSNCFVGLYSEWVNDGDYDWPPSCPICKESLVISSKPTIRLGCLHILHSECLIQHLNSFPPNTATAGFGCPTCKSQIWPPKIQKDMTSNLYTNIRNVISDSSVSNVLLNLPLPTQINPSLSPSPFSSSSPSAFLSSSSPSTTSSSSSSALPSSSLSPHSSSIETITHASSNALKEINQNSEKDKMGFGNIGEIVRGGEGEGRFESASDEPFMSLEKKEGNREKEKFISSSPNAYAASSSISSPSSHLNKTVQPLSPLPANSQGPSQPPSSASASQAGQGASIPFSISRKGSNRFNVGIDIAESASPHNHNHNHDHAYSDDESVANKYARRGSFYTQIRRYLGWSIPPILPVSLKRDGTGKERERESFGMNEDSAEPRKGRRQNRRSSSIDSRLLVLILAVISCLATILLLYFRLSTMSQANIKN